MRQLESELTEAQAEVLRLERDELPSAFTEDGISELRLPDGGPGAKRDLAVRGSLPADEPQHAAGLEWAIANGYEGSIRSIVTANFGMLHRAAALEYYNVMRGDNRAVVSLTETIHHSTLQAIALERARTGQPVDWENLGLTLIRHVRLLRPPTRPVALEGESDA
jgi:hypothetical protein